MLVLFVLFWFGFFLSKKSLGIRKCFPSKKNYFDLFKVFGLVLSLEALTPKDAQIRLNNLWVTAKKLFEYV